MNKVKVSVIIPIYNEAPAIREVLRRIYLGPMLDWTEKEIVIVDDGSTDWTMNAVNDFLEEYPEAKRIMTMHKCYINHGKGAALRAGFEIATGDIFLIQDGDLEYSPEDYPVLLAPFSDPDIAIVYGTRFSKGIPSGMKLPNLVANLLLTGLTAILYGQRITDEATCYKVFRRGVLDHFELHCRGFEFCPEFTAKSLRSGFRIHEVAIQYRPRGIRDGKKIRTLDGLVALYWLAKTRFTRLKRLARHAPA